MNKRLLLKILLVLLVIVCWVILIYLLVKFPITRTWAALSDYGVISQTSPIFNFLILIIAVMLSIKIFLERNTKNAQSALIAVMGCIIALLFPVDITNLLIRSIHWIGGLAVLSPPFSSLTSKSIFDTKTAIFIFILVVLPVVAITQTIIPAEILALILLSIWLIR